MITKYPLEDQRFDQPEYEPFWAAAAAARNATEPAHGHATAGQDPRRRRQEARDASSRATKAFSRTACCRATSSTAMSS
jgi:hypothetical protein